jgi:hypothetical protein
MTTKFIREGKAEGRRQEAGGRRSKVKGGIITRN